MVTGWRRAFCTSIPKKQESPVLPEKQQQHQSNCTKSPRFSSKFGFFSNPSTPRLQSQPVSSPSLRCRTTSTRTPTSSLPNSPKLHCRTSHFSNPSSPKSPSSFSFFKSTLCLSKGGRCGICLESVKTGQGTAIFTAECSHSFHFHCVAAHIRKRQLLICPVCSTTWKELPLLSLQHPEQPHEKSLSNIKTKTFRVYNDDEPLASPVSLSQFNPIPESEETENDDEEEFQGFFVTPRSNARNVEVRLSQEAAMVAAGRVYESYAVVMKVRAPTVTHGLERAAIDLVTVLDISGSATRLQLVKRAMRSIISLLNEKDRLSIVIFSSSSKRLLPLKRMSSSGRRSVRRIVDALGSNGQGMSVNDALKKAGKVLEDRREKNAVASIMILSDCHDKQSLSNPTNEKLPVVSTMRLSHSEIPVHSFGFGSCGHAPNEDAFCKIVNGLLSVVVQDVRLQLGFESGSAPAEIASVYSLTPRPASIGSNSDLRVGDMHSGEERELLVELKVPVSSRGSHRVMSVRSSYRDPFTQEMVYSRDESLVLPRLPLSVRSSSHSVARLRNLHVSMRAVAESRILMERNDVSGAQHLLTSARVLLMQSGSISAEEFIRGLESELSELKRRRLKQRVNNNDGGVEEKVEVLTPTSAWRAAERLAKVAIMRKHMNRVSDLHGFENARF
ncbi:hypothetical protein V6N13_111374 [Hibiscus sabdariffa]|uniref:Uncharacterized protein n=1 Tax=Hibiscus sabdariffa TaxID=183260 RepID=A0ABR2TK32_9ROSI